MADVTNRAAENGSIIIDDTETYTFTTGKLPCAVRALEPSVIATIESPNCENIGYYIGKTLDIESPIVLASIHSISLTSGAVQVVYT